MDYSDPFAGLLLQRYHGGFLVDSEGQDAPLEEDSAEDDHQELEQDSPAAKNHAVA